MKKLLQLTMVGTLMLTTLPLQGQRYLSEVFSSFTVIPDNPYAVNITVITGAPAPQTLHYDAYLPMGDTMSRRPCVIVAHTGSFLPSPQNGQATGSRKDTAIVDMCRKLAKRGFVAIAMEYRFGWNPVSGDQEVRTGTLLNAAYRGIQDVRTLVRYLRQDADSLNQHGIDTNNIIVGGMGTGGYLALGVAYLNSYDELSLPKFQDSNGNSFVDTSKAGDLEGKVDRLLSKGNFPGESSDIAFAFNLGGAAGDSTWIDAGEVAMASCHVPSDPFAPYSAGAVIVPTTGQFVVDVIGSQGVQSLATALGTNACFDSLTFTDPVSLQAATVNGGLNGLFPFYRPGVESSPWEYWDSTYWKTIPHPSMGNIHSAGLATNPDMSREKEMAYLDSALSFIVPRIVCCLGLANCNLAAGTENAQGIHAVSVYPNPSAGHVMIRTQNDGNRLRDIVLTDLNGRQVKVISGMSSTSYRLDHSDLSPGMYFLRIKTSRGVTTQKVLFD